jgi:hypothetical protein
MEPIIMKIGDEIAKWDSVHEALPADVARALTVKVSEIVGKICVADFALQQDFFLDLAYDVGLQTEIPFIAIEILERAVLRSPSLFRATSYIAAAARIRRSTA